MVGLVLEAEAMNEEQRERLKRLAVARAAKSADVAWKPTEEDRRFLRSINVSPK